jgi:hypothetical protein
MKAEPPTARLLFPLVFLWPVLAFYARRLYLIKKSNARFRRRRALGETDEFILST